MRIRHSQEMSVAQNQLMFNGEVLLTNCNSDNQSSFQIYQYGFPFPILPNLNLLPEKMSSTDMGEVLCSPSTPITLDKNKRIQDRLPQEVIDLVVGSASDGSMLQQFGFSQPVAEEISGILPKPVISSQLVSSQKRESEKNAVKSSEEVSLRPPATIEHEKGIDLNKTPQQKPKRKKHRPKVIREGKPVRTPKPVTPKPVTPKPAREKETPSGKRKYVRKKEVLNSSNKPSCPQWKDVDPKSACHTKSTRRRLDFNAELPPEKVGNVDQESESQTKTARRYLNFNAEGPHQRVGVLGPSIMFSHNSEAQSQDACISSSITRFTTKSAEPPALGRKVKENSPAGIKFDLNSSANDVATEYAIIPQTPISSSHPSRREVMGLHCMLNGHVNVMNNPPRPPQPSRREIIQESLKQFAWKNGSQKAACYSGISTESGKKSQLNLHNTSDMFFTGAKRGHTLVDGNRNSNNINFVNGYNRTNSFTEIHHGTYFPENHKKRRAEKEQIEYSSNASTERCTPSSGRDINTVLPSNCQVFNFAPAQWPMVTGTKKSPVVPDNCQVYSFADAQRLIAREKVRASEHMLSFEQREVGTKTVMEAHSQANNSALLITTKGIGLSTPVKPVRLTSTDCSQPFDRSDYVGKNNEGRISTPAKSSVLNNTGSNQHSTSVIMYRCNGSQGSETYGPQTCTEILSTNKQVKVRTKNCTNGEQTCSIRSMSLNAKQMSTQEEEAASSSYDPSHGKTSVRLSGSALGNGKVKKSCPQVSSHQDVQSSINFQELPHGMPVPKAIVLHGDPINDIVQKMECLNINEIRESIAAEVQNALVPYGEGGTMMVPYEGPFDPTKKRRARAKVDLDPETERVWKLLMGKEGSDEGTDMDKEKWWENERRIFHGRVDSFIARMHLVQGDRRFSRWKGSVVDSVVGVFLTQNVSDHLSSSAFMSMAARFPMKQNGNNREHNDKKVSTSVEQQDSVLISFDHNMLKEKKTGQELCHQGSWPLPEADCIAGVLIANNNEPCQSNNASSVLSEYDFQKREFGIGQKPLNYITGTSVTLTGSTGVSEAEDRRSTDDVVSSQNSVVSSQNSSENIVQTASKIKLRSLSEFDSEGLMNRGMCNVLDSSTSFMELLQMAEATRFPDQYNHGNGSSLYTECCGADDQMAWSEADKRTYVSNQEIPPKGECSSMYRPNYQPFDKHHDIMGVSCAPFMSYNFQNPSHSKFMARQNITGVRAENISHLHPAISGINTTNDINKMGRKFNPLAECSMQNLSQNDFKDLSCAPSSSSLQNSLPSRSMRMSNVNLVSEESSSYLPTTYSVVNSENRVKNLENRVSLTNNSTSIVSWDGLMGVCCTSSPSYHHHSFSSSRSTELGDVTAEREKSYDLPSSASGMQTTNNINIMNGYVPLVEKSNEETMPLMLSTLKKIPALDICYSINKHSVQPLTLSETEHCGDKHDHCQSNNAQKQTKSSAEKISSEKTATLQQKERGAEQVCSSEHTARIQAGMQNGGIHQTCLNSHGNSREALEASEAVESNLKDESHRSQEVSASVANNMSKGKKVKSGAQKKTYDWDSLRKQVLCSKAKKERSGDSVDTVDWEAVRCSDVKEISQTIRERGMNNMLAERIKEFLNRLINDHGSIDLEWLRDVPPDSAKDYLLSIRGLGLKSVECVRLLTLHHLAFPVDTNVGRICVRLGWVPLQPLPESLQLHLLEMYPVLETIQKYLWPRLCKLDQRTLYELHYQLITFGKVFCTKSKPNCNACPMRGECKHFASAFASARLALPGLEEKRLISSTVPVVSDIARHSSILNPTPIPQLEGGTFSWEGTVFSNCEPIIEEPATPEPEFIETSESAIEDAFDEDPEEIPTIKLNLENFTKNLQDYVQENNMELQEADMSKALVAITAEAASIPMPRLKNVSRLRTEHQVYELPDSHRLLKGLDQREPDDPCFYLLAIWSPGETSQSTEQSTKSCDSQDTGNLCDDKTCFACNSIREAQSQTVRATLLIPCRTAMRGSFPLNGTYFQVNEVFADHDSSRNPMNVPREWIWNLPRRTVYFGTSIPTIFKGLTTEGIQHCFWRGFVCVRGFDRTTRAPKPLYARLHFPASKTVRNKKAAAAIAKGEE